VPLSIVAAPHELQCPIHHVPEVNPETGKLFIRAYKVTDHGYVWSQCLICSGFYTVADVAGTYDKQVVEETPAKHDIGKGWFKEKL
jgi:hypothetical protein